MNKDQRSLFDNYCIKNVITPTFTEKYMCFYNFNSWLRKNEIKGTKQIFLASLNPRGRKSKHF